MDAHVKLATCLKRTVTSELHQLQRLSTRFIFANFLLHTLLYFPMYLFNSCTDIDECLYAIDPVCSQKCINTPGSYLCGCIEGYVLRPDLRTCKALGGAVKLIMASRGDIRQIPLGSNKHTSIIKGQHNAVAIDYHYRKGLLFWTDIATDVIKMAFMNGTGVRNVIKWGLDTPAGIAVDWIHDLLYWTDAGTRRIEVATFDGKLRAVIVATDLEKPRAIVVHPDEALVFWTDWGMCFYELLLTL